MSKAVLPPAVFFLMRPSAARRREKSASCRFACLSSSHGIWVPGRICAVGPAIGMIESLGSPAGATVSVYDSRKSKQREKGKLLQSQFVDLH